MAACTHFTHHHHERISLRGIRRQFAPYPCGSWGERRLSQTEGWLTATLIWISLWRVPNYLWSLVAILPIA